MQFLHLLILGVIWLTPIVTKAQLLSGRVLDRQQNPLINAYIYKSDHGVHAHTNELGQFTCPGLLTGDTLLIQFLGFERLQHLLSEKDLKGGVTLILKEKRFELDQVVISNDVKSSSTVSAIDLNIRPVTSSQEILTGVPGLMIAQHAGGGKAEQIFLRGFDIDHGTDIAISVDGMPVNMVSHAHGQGYADLHFVIPETIQNIDFAKGPYYADKGNFNTAGYVQFKTRDRLDGGTVGMELGQFNTQRFLAMFNLLDKNQRSDAYVAAEYLATDGPFESPQSFDRLNIMAKYTQRINSFDRFSVSLSRFSSRWDASGQIPTRLVKSGEITRFGYVDNTEGGETARTNIQVQYTKAIGDDGFIQNNIYHVYYDFELYSNFTFFLEDPNNGDQIRQREKRHMTGFSSTYHDNLSWLGKNSQWRLGVGLRYDDIDDLELSHTKNRSEVILPMSYGQVNEVNYFTFSDLEIDLGQWMINPGIRFDFFNNHYANELATSNVNQSSSDATVSPNLNVIFNPSFHWQFYLKMGTGFHSNDTRVVVDQNGKNTLPSGYGIDLGAIWKPVKRLWLNVTFWDLELDQEFVYVGDAGIVEPSGRTTRRGVEAGMRLQLSDWLFANTDIVYSHARFRDVESDNNYIPLAVDLMSSGGLTMRLDKWTAGLRYRYIKDRPAIEDNSIRALGYFVTDANVNYNLHPFEVGLVIENLLNTDWNEAQFATESRLKGELNSVEEIHFTPGVPFFARLKINYLF